MSTAAAPVAAAAVDGRIDRRPSRMRTVTVAVAGNPNTGKSTLVNALAGSRLQVGNWPGVTVEKKAALLEAGGSRIRLVDLPGAYSLSPYSQEEIIARDFLLREKPDLVINVVDATNLERNLYLTVQLLETGLPVVMALNIFDEAEAKGFRIDVAGIERRLGVVVVPTAATKGQGTRELLAAVLEVAGDPAAHRPKPPGYAADIERAIDETVAIIRERGPEAAAGFPERWLACKLMEGDDAAAREAGVALDGREGGALEELRRAHGGDLESLLAAARHGLAAGLARGVLRRPGPRKVEITEKIDGVAGAFTPLSAYAFMVFVLLYMPCVVVAIAMRQEFGSWKWFGVAFAYQSALAWGVAFAVYQGGRLLGLGG